MRGIVQDLRLAARTLGRAPGFAAVAILTLALGLGANTAIFSLVNSLILRRLPVRDPSKLVIMTSSYDDISDNAKVQSKVGLPWSYAAWEQVQQRSALFDGVLAWSPARLNIAPSGQTQLVSGVWVSGSFFHTLGVPTLIGHAFSEIDDRRGGGPDGPVAVISYSFWQRHFGGAADAIGRTLTVENVALTVVGVTEPDFYGADVGRAFDVMIPLGVEPLVHPHEVWRDRSGVLWLTIMARLKPGQTLDAATAAIRNAQPAIRAATLPDGYPPEVVERYLREGIILIPAATGDSALRSRYTRPLLTMMVVATLVLLIACTNVANLLLARAMVRRHELSMRLALGASRWRLVRPLLVESVVLGAGGAVAGLFLALWGSRLLVRQLSTQTNLVFLDLSIDWRVLGFAIALAVVTVLVSGVAPAWLASTVAPIAALKDRNASSGTRVGFASGLVVAQVAMSIVLVATAGVFLRSFLLLEHRPLGFERDHVLLVNVNAQRAAVDPTQRVSMYGAILDAIRAVPGVADAAVSAVTPASDYWAGDVNVLNSSTTSKSLRTSYVNYISPGWFSTFGTPVVAGRDFLDRDRQGALPVAVVNQTFVRAFLNTADPIGQRVVLTLGATPGPPVQIIGIAADAVYRSLRDPVPPTIYLPLAQYDEDPSVLSSVSVSVRSKNGSPVLLVRSLAAAIGAVNSDLALTFRLLTDQVESSLTQERVLAILSGLFGGLALLLAALGLYGVTSYTVNCRRAEISIRMSLGAVPGEVIGMVLRRVIAMVSMGVTGGTLLNWWIARFISPVLLYEVRPRDPSTIAGAAVILVLVGCLAAWLPARRASRIDPAQVLREA